MSDNDRMRILNGVEFLSATSLRVFACGDPDCRHAHIIGYDEHGLPFCEIVISEGSINEALDIIRDGGGDTLQ